jgi:hypothetical protein
VRGKKREQVLPGWGTGMKTLRVMSGRGVKYKKKKLKELKM